MPHNGETVWVNGELVDASQAVTSLFSHSLHYGLSVFEGVRAYQRHDQKASVFRLDSHIERLLEGCRLALIEPNYSCEQLIEATVALALNNKYQNGYIRPLIFQGEGSLRIDAENNPVVSSIMGWHWDSIEMSKKQSTGISMQISSWHKAGRLESMPSAKLSGQYLLNQLAAREAKKAGFDDAFMLDASGYIVEATGANVFVVKNERLYTPGIESPILPGVTRDTVLVLAAEMGLIAHEKPISRELLYLADEVFLSGTAVEIMPVVKVSHRSIGQGRVGPITKALQQQYSDVVRAKNIYHPEWHTLIE